MSTTELVSSEATALKLQLAGEYQTGAGKNIPRQQPFLLKRKQSLISLEDKLEVGVGFVTKSALADEKQPERATYK